jgi:hypothetical protein
VQFARSLTWQMEVDPSHHSNKHERFGVNVSWAAYLMSRRCRFMCRRSLSGWHHPRVNILAKYTYLCYAPPWSELTLTSFSGASKYRGRLWPAGGGPSSCACVSSTGTFRNTQQTLCGERGIRAVDTGRTLQQFTLDYHTLRLDHYLEP